LFFLQQSETDKIEPLGRGRAAFFATISAAEVRQGLWLEAATANQTRELFDRACEIAKTIPAFVLRVSLSGRFWEEIEKVLGR
jgi:SynChlorMet cassette protein ScmC